MMSYKYGGSIGFAAAAAEVPEVLQSIHRTLLIPPTDGKEERRLKLSLLGAFELIDSTDTVVLSGGSQRLLAFVALQGRSVSRGTVAESLWPEGSQTQAHASLRSAIWRLEEIAKTSMTIDVLELNLAPEVVLDLENAKVLARRILIVDTVPEEGDMTPAAIAALSTDLLPDWYDDWAIVRAEDWRQLRLHALEALSQKLLALGRFADAIGAAAEAEKADPLRESPNALLIRIHLAEGNQSEAVKKFLAYRELLRRELGIEPTTALRELVRALLN